MHSKQGSHDSHVGIASNPQVHFDTIVQQIDTFARQRIDTQVGRGWQEHTIAPCHTIGVIDFIVFRRKPRVMAHFVNRITPRVNKDLGRRYSHACHQMPSLDTFVWMHIRAATKRHILDERQCIQRQETQIIGNKFITVPTTRLLLLSWWWWHRVPRDSPFVTTSCRPNHFHAHLLQS